MTKCLPALRQRMIEGHRVFEQKNRSLAAVHNAWHQPARKVASYPHIPLNAPRYRYTSDSAASRTCPIWFAPVHKVRQTLQLLLRSLYRVLRISIVGVHGPE